MRKPNTLLSPDKKEAILIRAVLHERYSISEKQLAAKYGISTSALRTIRIRGAEKYIDLRKHSTAALEEKLRDLGV